MTDTADEAWRTQHGLYYVGRDNSTVVRLDLDPRPPFTRVDEYSGVLDYMVHGVERSILRALLLHALKTLDEADDPLRIAMPVAYPMTPEGSTASGR